MGVVIRSWVWLDSIGEVSGWCCKEVYRFPHITYPYSTCITSFLQQQHPSSLFIKKNLFHSFIYIHDKILHIKFQFYKQAIYINIFINHNIHVCT